MSIPLHTVLYDKTLKSSHQHPSAHKAQDSKLYQQFWYHKKFLDVLLHFSVSALLTQIAVLRAIPKKLKITESINLITLFQLISKLFPRTFSKPLYNFKALPMIIQWKSQQVRSFSVAATLCSKTYHALLLVCHFLCYSRMLPSKNIQ